jgi:hypothetical protein
LSCKSFYNTIQMGLLQSSQKMDFELRKTLLNLLKQGYRPVFISHETSSIYQACQLHTFGEPYKIAVRNSHIPAQIICAHIKLQL